MMDSDRWSGLAEGLSCYFVEIPIGAGGRGTVRVSDGKKVVARFDYSHDRCSSEQLAYDAVDLHRGLSGQ